jgi:hypothetical protein
VSEATTLAKSARESLAKGLNALQGDPAVPPELIELAAPIAQAMGALHQIEKSGGASFAPQAEMALKNTREALAKLQGQGANIPAVGKAMEHVAMSLGVLTSLTTLGNQAPSAPAPAPASVKAGGIPRPAVGTAKIPANQTAPQPPAASGPTTQPVTPAVVQAAAQQVAQQHAQQAAAQQQAAQQQAAQQQAAQQQAAQQQAAQQQAAQHAAQQQQAAQHAAQQQQAAQHAAQQQQAAQHAAQQQQAAQHAAQQQQAAQHAAQQQPAQGAKAAVSQRPAPVGTGTAIEVALGAHSPTNFYKGLSGNDIIDHGGLFVATYIVPKIGTPVRLRISLPGGFEFEAMAIVQWSREAVDPFGDAQPGFGARFTQIANEARQLVYRYVRNREPIFHDDM